MENSEFIQVDPAGLHLLGSREEGADPKKLKRQFEKFGLSIEGMPPLNVQRGTDGELVIFDGVTRATRVAKYLPGIKIMAEVTGLLNAAVGNRPTIRETL